MFKAIEGAADCEIRSVIRFLDARNVLPSEIHHQIVLSFLVLAYSSIPEPIRWVFASAAIAALLSEQLCILLLSMFLQKKSSVYFRTVITSA